MRIASELYDHRICARNVLVELTIGEYLELAKCIMHKNEFQRKRVRSASSVYALLREDLDRGCIMPPVVLALTSDVSNTVSGDNLVPVIVANKEHLVILDGLQRTHTLIDLMNGLVAKGNESDLKRVESQKIRAEFYIGINRLGILYRMLTLNTGQTPMSLRQQIEILYIDYAAMPFDGIELLREVDEARVTQVSQHNFREVIEGFNSYLDRDELPLERTDILENIKGLEKLSKENSTDDLFRGYIMAWDAFVRRVNDLCGDATVSDDYLEANSMPFGRTALQVFKKAQAMSGFGAAVGKLRDFGKVSGFDNITDSIANLQIENPVVFMDTINRQLEWIKQNTKKIGNAQRTFFLHLFREVLNPESDYYCKPTDAAEPALRKYQSQNL